MAEQELVQVLASFKQALDYLNEQNRALNDKIDELSAVLYDDILQPVQQAITYAEDENSYLAFSDKYKEGFEPYAKEYSALYNGNDVARDVYDTYKEHSEEYDEELFVEEAIKSIAKTIQETKAALGIPAEEKVEITETEDGSVEITPADPTEDEQVEVEEGVEEEVIDDPEEIAAFEAELEKQLKK